MFPCKVKIDQLDRKANLLDFNANKAETKGKVKKVATKVGEKTPFYFIADYFEKNGKAIGDFLTLGDSPKLEKHFLQNEMKNSADSVMGKKQDIKTAAMGEVYVKNVDGKDVLHFEPHEKAKVPAGKWAKILKNLKSYFAGMKAVVVIDGQVIQAEESEEEGGEKEADEAPTDTPTPSADKTAAEKTQTIQELADNYKDMLAQFKEVQQAEHDADLVKSLYRNLISWEKSYETMEPAAKEKLAKFYLSFEATRKEVKKILKVDQNIGEDVATVTKIVTDYIAIDDQNSAAAVKLKTEANELLDKLLKYCEFVSAKKLTVKCQQLKKLLAE